MSTDAKATGYLELNINGFDDALKTAKRLMVGFVGVFSAYKLEQFFVGGVKGAIDFGKEMQSASRAMGGFDPGQLLLTQKALEKTGMGAEEARGHVGDFIKEGRHLSDLFGGEANYGDALRSAGEQYGKQAEVLSRSGAKLQSVWNTMESVSSKVKTFFLSLVEQFVGPLQTALDMLDKIDLSGIGASFGKSIKNAADILIGVFKNGDMMEAIRLGMTIAFQDSVNWLVGGLKYASDYANTTLYNSLIEAWNDSVRFFSGLCDTIVSSELSQGLYHGALSAWAKTMEIYLDGIAELKEYFVALWTWAGQEIVESNVASWKAAFSVDFWRDLAMGMWDHFKDTIGFIKDALLYCVDVMAWQITHLIPEAFKKAKDSIKGMFGIEDIMPSMPHQSFEEIKSSGFARADSLRGAAESLRGFGESESTKAAPGLALIAGAFTDSAKKLTAVFEKGSVFNTDSDKKRLASIIGEGLRTGIGMEADSRAKHGKDEKLATSALTSFSGSSSHVIADSLAKVGGGGNFLRVGQSLAERTAQEQLRAQKATAENTAAIRNKMGGKAKPEPLGH